MFHMLHVLGMNDDLWDRICGLGRETWNISSFDLLPSFVANFPEDVECQSMPKYIGCYLY